jgi:hypothetical protein
LVQRCRQTGGSALQANRHACVDNKHLLWTVAAAFSLVAARCDRHGDHLHQACL